MARSNEVVGIYDEVHPKGMFLPVVSYYRQEVWNSLLSSYWKNEYSASGEQCDDLFPWESLQVLMPLIWGKEFQGRHTLLVLIYSSPQTGFVLF